MLRNEMIGNSINDCKRLVLGTAQLGMNYGIANRSGKPSSRETNAIIQRAWGEGIRVFDTAQAYGDSESILGEQFAALNIQNDVKVVSKVVLTDPLQWKDIEQKIRNSLTRLNISKLYGLLLHD